MNSTEMQPEDLPNRVGTDGEDCTPDDDTGEKSQTRASVVGDLGSFQNRGPQLRRGSTVGTLQPTLNSEKRLSTSNALGFGPQGTNAPLAGVEKPTTNHRPSLLKKTGNQGTSMFENRLSVAGPRTAQAPNRNSILKPRGSTASVVPEAPGSKPRASVLFVESAREDGEDDSKKSVLFSIPSDQEKVRESIRQSIKDGLIKLPEDNGSDDSDSDSSSSSSDDDGNPSARLGDSVDSADSEAMPSGPMNSSIPAIQVGMDKEISKRPSGVFGALFDGARRMSRKSIFGVGVDSRNSSGDSADNGIAGHHCEFGLSQQSMRTLKKFAATNEPSEYFHRRLWEWLLGIGPNPWAKQTDKQSVGTIWGTTPTKPPQCDFLLENLTSELVTHHDQPEDMKMMMRDQNVNFSYYHVFQTDWRSGIEEEYSYVVRVYSEFANVMEFVRIFCALWAVVWATAICAFWSVSEELDHFKGGWLQPLDIAVDIICILCLIAQFNTTILDQLGKETCHRQKIFRSIIHSYQFWFDVVSLVPIMPICDSLGVSHRWPILIKSLRGFRLSKVPPKCTYIPSTAFTVFRLSLVLLLGGHIFACAWFMVVHDATDTFQLQLPNQRLANYDEHSTYEQMWEYYVFAANEGIYLLLAIDRVAHSPLQNFFHFAAVPVGAIAHAYIFGQIILLVQRQSTVETQIQEHTMQVSSAMKSLGLAPELQLRMLSYFTYIRVHQSKGEIDSLFRNICPQLKFELYLYFYANLVSKCPIFRRIKPRMIREMVMSLQDDVYLPGDLISRPGEVGDSMYFVARGHCSVMTGDLKTVLTRKSRGSHFGEVSLLAGVKRTAFVRAETFCVLACLTREKFAPVLVQHPDQVDLLLAEVRNPGERERLCKECFKSYGLTPPGGAPGGARQTINTRRSEKFGGMRNTTTGEGGRPMGSFLVNNDDAQGEDGVTKMVSHTPSWTPSASAQLGSLDRPHSFREFHERRRPSQGKGNLTSSTTLGSTGSSPAASSDLSSAGPKRSSKGSSGGKRSSGKRSSRENGKGFLPLPPKDPVSMRPGTPAVLEDPVRSASPSAEPSPSTEQGFMGKMLSIGSKKSKEQKQSGKRESVQSRMSVDLQDGPAPGQGPAKTSSQRSAGSAGKVGKSISFGASQSNGAGGFGESASTESERKKKTWIPTNVFTNLASKAKTLVKGIEKEVESGATKFVENEDEEMVREVQVCNLRIFSPSGQVLLQRSEKAPPAGDGEEEPTTKVLKKMPGTKRMPGESIWATVERLLQKDLPSMREYLEIDYTRLEDLVEERESARYGGLMSRYVTTLAEVYIKSKVVEDETVRKKIGLGPEGGVFTLSHLDGRELGFEWVSLDYCVQQGIPVRGTPKEKDDPDWQVSPQEVGNSGSTRSVKNVGSQRSVGNTGSARSVVAKQSTEAQKVRKLASTATGKPAGATALSPPDPEQRLSGMVQYVTQLVALGQQQDSRLAALENSLSVINEKVKNGADRVLQQQGVLGEEIFALLTEDMEQCEEDEDMDYGDMNIT